MQEFIRSVCKTLDINELEHAGYSFTHGIYQKDLIEIVQQLGPIRVDLRSPEPVREIRPQPADSAKQNTLSSRYGTNAFPFHTDTAHWDQPARYLVLYCVDPGEGKRPTLLQDSRAWQISDAEKELACRALWTTGHVRPRLCMLAARTTNYLTIRYDKDCMRPMTAEARRLEALIEFRIDQTDQKQIDWGAGDLLVIDNQRMLHARGKSNRTDANRILKRILIGGD
jgi:alpha-ketoglutarate-dependent taurine dioxygenase